MWKTKVELHILIYIFHRLLLQWNRSQPTSDYGWADEGLPTDSYKWTDTGRLDFSKTEEIPATQGRARIPLSNGFIIQTYWDLLEARIKT